MAFGKDTLKGIKGFLMNVENINPDVEERAAFCDFSLRNLIEENVKEMFEINNIKILTDEVLEEYRNSDDENVKRPAFPCLYISVPVSMHYSGLYVYSIVIILAQYIDSEKYNYNSADVTPSWISMSAGWVTEDIYTIDYNVRKQVEEFIEDFLEMNSVENK